MDEGRRARCDAYIREHMATAHRLDSGTIRRRLGVT
jgi:hypothetical protein